MCLKHAGLGRDGRGKSEEQADCELFRKPAFNIYVLQATEQVDDGEVKQGCAEEPVVFKTRNRKHAVEDEPDQSCSGGKSCEQECQAIARVEEVAAPQYEDAFRAQAIENTVGDIDQPGSQTENSERCGRQMDVNDAREAPCPEHSHSRSIKTEQMPPLRELHESAGEEPGCEPPGPDFCRQRDRGDGHVSMIKRSG
uniref:Uncharacterized protein n=1 Tax=Paracidobacterium acidisoli TaxID=2303751 RepID=A0A372IP84_9BACT